MVCSTNLKKRTKYIFTVFVIKTEMDFSRFLNQKSTQNSTKSSFNCNTNFLCKSTHKTWGATAVVNDNNLSAVNNQQKPETTKSLSLEAQGFVTLVNTAKKSTSRRRKRRIVIREDSTDIDINHESSVVNIPSLLPSKLPSVISLPKVLPPPSLSSVFLPLTKGLSGSLIDKLYQPSKESAFDKIKEKEELLLKNRNEINKLLSIPEIPPSKISSTNVDIISNCSTHTMSSRTSIDSIDLLKSHHRKKHRMKPMNIVLNTSLMENIVPILKRKEEESFVDNAPMFLNAEQWLKMKAEQQIIIRTAVVKEQKEEEVEDIDIDIDMNVNVISDVIHDDGKEDQPLDIWNVKPIIMENKGNWAQKLFPKYIEANLKQKKIEQNIEVEKRMKEHLHDIQVEKILPMPATDILSSKCTPVWIPKYKPKRNGPQLHFHSSANTNGKKWRNKNSSCWMRSSSSNANPWRNVQTPDPIDLQLNRNLSREISAESEDAYAYSRSGSVTVSDSVSSVCSVSQAAMDWRLKQISYGKNTLGYQTYIREHPCKEFHYRRDRGLPMTPNANDMIGKKRWVGKLRKWRKELHFFDNKYDNECKTRSSVYILKERKEGECVTGEGDAETVVNVNSNS